MAIWTFSLEKQINKELLPKAIKWVKEAIDYVKEAVKKNTPIDTWELIDNYKTTWPIVYRDEIVWSVYNDTDYAAQVEYGMWREYNYHRNWKVFYRWLGARMMTKAVDSSKVQNWVKKIIEFYLEK